MEAPMADRPQVRIRLTQMEAEKGPVERQAPRGALRQVLAGKLYVAGGALTDELRHGRVHPRRRFVRSRGQPLAPVTGFTEECVETGRAVLFGRAEGVAREGGTESVARGDWVESAAAEPALLTAEVETVAGVNEGCIDFLQLPFEYADKLDSVSMLQLSSFAFQLSLKAPNWKLTIIFI